MGSLDLDARRAEYEGESHHVTLGGKEWVLPARFPLMAVEYVSTGRVSAAVELLFGPDSIDVLGPLLNSEDLEAILGELYGIEPEAAPRAVRRRLPPAQDNGGRARPKAKTTTR